MRMSAGGVPVREDMANFRSSTVACDGSSTVKVDREMVMIVRNMHLRLGDKIESVDPTNSVASGGP